MPVYEYECETHGIIERTVKFHEEEPTKCSILKSWEGPPCGKPFKKLLSRGFFWFNDKRKH